MASDVLEYRGFRRGGHTYQLKDSIPLKYAAEFQNKRKDPAFFNPELPRNAGRPAVPHTMMFSGLLNTLSRSLRNPDEAMRHSKENAAMMRRDPMVMGPLFQRQMAVALLPWEVVPEDEKDQAQQKVAAELTELIKRIPRFTEYCRSLLEAVWFGRYGVQNMWGNRHTVDGKRQFIKRWQPVHGDKFVFRMEDGHYRYDPDQFGVKVHVAAGQSDFFAGDHHIEWTPDGAAIFLGGWERSLFTLHKHFVMDGEFEDVYSAGQIHGVGLRHFLYWTWLQKQEALAQLAEVVERTAMGFTIYYYPAGNQQAEGEVTRIAEEQANKNQIILPFDPSMPDSYRIEQIPPNTGGIGTLQNLIDNYFGNWVIRFILGQTLSMRSEATGLGSGVADLHRDSFLQVITYDAMNLEETLTNQVVNQLLAFNFPKFREHNFQFKFKVQDPKVEEILSGYRQAWEMGLKLKATDVMQAIGAEMPDDDEISIQNPAYAQAMMEIEGAQQGQDQQPQQPEIQQPTSPEEEAQALMDQYGPVLQMQRPGRSSHYAMGVIGDDDRMDDVNRNKSMVQYEIQEDGDRLHFKAPEHSAYVDRDGNVEMTRGDYMGFDMGGLQAYAAKVYEAQVEGGVPVSQEMTLSSVMRKAAKHYAKEPFVQGSAEAEPGQKPLPWADTQGPALTLGAERQERKTVPVSKIKFTPEEDQLFDSLQGHKNFKKAFTKKADKNPDLTPDQFVDFTKDEVRRIKARFPESQGFISPDSYNFTGFDSNGELTWTGRDYDFARKKTGENYGPSDKGTKEYKSHAKKLATRVTKEVANVFNRAQGGDKAAQKIVTEARWYQSMRRKLRSEFGGFGDLFADYLAASSAKTAVPLNWRYASEMLRDTFNGEHDDKLPVWEKWRDDLDAAAKEMFEIGDKYVEEKRQQAKDKGKLDKFTEPVIDTIKQNSPEFRQAAKKVEDLRAQAKELMPVRTEWDPKKKEFKKYGSNGDAILYAITNTWRDWTKRGRKTASPKTINFAGNLIGLTDAATIDVWAARHLHRMNAGKKKDSLIPPHLEQGVAGEMLPGGETVGQFGFGQDVFAEAVDKIKAHPELSEYAEFSNMTPADLQALVWFLEKEYWTRNNLTKGWGEGGSFEAMANLEGIADQGEVRQIESTLNKTTLDPKDLPDIYDRVTQKSLIDEAKQLRRQINKTPKGDAKEKLKKQYTGLIAEALVDAKVNAANQLSDMKRTVDRFVSSVSEDSSAQAKLIDAAYKDAGINDVRAMRAFTTATPGENPTHDVDFELVAREGYNPLNIRNTIMQLADDNDQDSAYLARRVREEEEADPLFHRPGIEIYFRNTELAQEAFRRIQELTEESESYLPQFNVVVDGRPSAKMRAGEAGDMVGLRAIVLPESKARGDASFAASVGAMSDDELRQDLINQRHALHDLAQRVMRDVPGVSSAFQDWYEVETRFRGDYNAKQSGDAGEGSEGIDGQAWTGRSVREAIAAAAERSEKGGGKAGSDKGQRVRNSRGVSSESDAVASYAKTYQEFLDEHHLGEHDFHHSHKWGHRRGLKRYATAPAGKQLFTTPHGPAAEIARSLIAKNADVIGDAPEPRRVRKLDQSRSKAIADAFASSQHRPNDPEVRKAYQALADEALQQYQALVDAGYKFTLHGADGGYANSVELVNDLNDNKHLQVYSTLEGYGPSQLTAIQQSEDPMLQGSGFKDSQGKAMLVNDVFRAVHDYFGHGGTGSSFGPIGEENAWLTHSRMFSPDARRALTTETRGQNSWVNFGPHLRREDGSIPKKDEPGYVHPSQRPFGEQKTTLLPDDMVFDYDSHTEESQAGDKAHYIAPLATAALTALPAVLPALTGGGGEGEKEQYATDPDMLVGDVNPDGIPADQQRPPSRLTNAGLQMFADAYPHNATHAQGISPNNKGKDKRRGRGREVMPGDTVAVRRDLSKTHQTHLKRTMGDEAYAQLLDVMGATKDPHGLTPQTIHDAYRVGKGDSSQLNSENGKPLTDKQLHDVNWGNRAMVALKDAEFVVDQEARARIGNGLENKSPMASAKGTYWHSDVSKLDVENDPELLEVRFNPMTDHHFVDLKGHALKGAGEVYLVGGRAFVKDPQYMKQSESEGYKTVGGKFSKFSDKSGTLHNKYSVSRYAIGEVEPETVKHEEGGWDTPEWQAWKPEGAKVYEDFTPESMGHKDEFRATKYHENIRDGLHNRKKRLEDEIKLNHPDNSKQEKERISKHLESMGLQFPLTKEEAANVSTELMWQKGILPESATSEYWAEEEPLTNKIYNTKLKQLQELESQLELYTTQKEAYENSLPKTGEPIVVRGYHGTGIGELEAFNPEFRGSNTGAFSAKLGDFHSAGRDTAETYRREYIVPIKGVASLPYGKQKMIFNGMQENYIEDVYTEAAKELSPREFTEFFDPYSSSWSDLSDTEQKEAEEAQKLAAQFKDTDGNDIRHSDIESEVEYYYPFEDYVKDMADNNPEKLKQRLHTALEIYNQDQIDWTDEQLQPTKKHLHENYIKFKNPYVYDYKGEEYREESYANIIQRAKEAGHDGVILMHTEDAWGYNTAKPDNIIVSFSGDQVKDVDNVRPTNKVGFKYATGTGGAMPAATPAAPEPKAAAPAPEAGPASDSMVDPSSAESGKDVMGDMIKDAAGQAVTGGSAADSASKARSTKTSEWIFDLETPEMYATDDANDINKNVQDEVQKRLDANLKGKPGEGSTPETAGENINKDVQSKMPEPPQQTKMKEAGVKDASYVDPTVGGEKVKGKGVGTSEGTKKSLDDIKAENAAKRLTPEEKEMADKVKKAFQDAMTSEEKQVAEELTNTPDIPSEAKGDNEVESGVQSPEEVAQELETGEKFGQYPGDVESVPDVPETTLPEFEEPEDKPVRTEEEEAQALEEAAELELDQPMSEEEVEGWLEQWSEQPEGTEIDGWTKAMSPAGIVWMKDGEFMPDDKFADKLGGDKAIAERLKEAAKTEAGEWRAKTHMSKLFGFNAGRLDQLDDQTKQAMDQHLIGVADQLGLDFSDLPNDKLKAQKAHEFISGKLPELENLVKSAVGGGFNAEGDNLWQNAKGSMDYIYEEAVKAGWEDWDPSLSSMSQSSKALEYLQSLPPSNQNASLYSKIADAVGGPQNLAIIAAVLVATWGLSKFLDGGSRRSARGRR